MNKKFKIEEFIPSLIENRKDSLYICAGGFEDRVKGIVDNLQVLNEKVFRYSLILEYTVHKDDNKTNLNFLDESLKKYSSYLLKNVIIDTENLLLSRNSLRDRLKAILQEKFDTIFIDISGMTNFLILLTLKMIHTFFYNKKIVILYTEAKSYYPKEDEKDAILELAEKRDDESILKLSKQLQAAGARETVILADFKGSFREDFPIALIFFLGCEPSRAIGLLETYRPNLVIPCYGVSPYEHFKWRTEFSIELHKKFGVLEQYPHLRENKIVSIFDISEIINELEGIYTSEIDGRIFYENYNVAISPQYSKLQAVATYLFSQTHPDVQVIFCLPGRYNPKRYSEGIGKSWSCEL